MSKLQFFVYPAVAALSLAAAVSAHAQSTEGADFDALSSGQARVVANPAAPAPRTTQLPAVLVRGERLPSVDMYGYDYNPLAEAKSLKTRSEVRAEVLAGIRGETFAHVYGENIGPFFYANVQPKAVVRAGNAAVGQ